MRTPAGLTVTVPPVPAAKDPKARPAVLVIWMKNNGFAQTLEAARAVIPKADMSRPTIKLSFTDFIGLAPIHGKTAVTVKVPL